MQAQAPQTISALGFGKLLLLWLFVLVLGEAVGYQLANATGRCRR